MSQKSEAQEKLYELQPWTHWAVVQWLNDCWKENKKFKVLEVKRDDKRQAYLLAQGRTKSQIDNLVWSGRCSYEMGKLAKKYVSASHMNKPIVTWTGYSKHLEGYACDLKPEGYTRGKEYLFEEIAVIGRKYGIRHPLKGDLWHFEFNRVQQRPLVLSVKERMKVLNRGIERARQRGILQVVRLYNNVLLRLKTRSGQ